MIRGRNVAILATQPAHIAAMRDRLRDEDRRECESAGLRAGKALWRSYRGSALVRTAFVDGEIAAMWGVGGCPLGGTGQPWLLTTPVVERAPVAFIREGRQEVAEMLTVFPILVGFVDASYHRAVRLLGVLGFEVDNPLPFGANGALFRRYHIERLA
jgi:hypothetical protein